MTKFQRTILISFIVKMYNKDFKMTPEDFEDMAHLLGLLTEDMLKYMETEQFKEKIKI